MQYSGLRSPLQKADSPYHLVSSDDDMLVHSRSRGNASDEHDRREPEEPNVLHEEKMRLRNAHFRMTLQLARIAMRIGDDPRYIGTSEVLGAGSFGIVTLSYRPDGGGLWLRTAVKRISLRNEKSFSVALQIAQLVARELTFLRRVGDSPYVVPLFDPWFDCVKRVIALPMDAGECSLEQYALRCRYRFPPLVLLSICVQCARAVEHVHRHGVVHRDVKPDNFVVNIVRTAVGTGGGGGGGNVNKNSSNSNRESSGGSGLGDAQSVLVRMVDFGLACSVEEVVQESKHWAGTPPYMAPEAFPDRDKVVTHSTACDVWSLGVMFFRLATGVFPVFQTGETWRSPPFDALYNGRLWMPAKNAFDEPISAESLAVMSIAASMLVIDTKERPTAEWVVQQLCRSLEDFRGEGPACSLGQGGRTATTQTVLSAENVRERAEDTAVRPPLLRDTEPLLPLRFFLL